MTEIECQNVSELKQTLMELEIKEQELRAKLADILRDKARARLTLGKIANEWRFDEVWG